MFRSVAGDEKHYENKKKNRSKGVDIISGRQLPPWA